jgi:hypothetical protein
VDESAEMLAHVRGAETVQARIEELELGRRFDAVLLASNLVTAEPEQRRAFLETCRRHSDLVLVEGLPLGWSPEDGETTLGEVVSRLRVERVEDGVVHGEIEYKAVRESWRHSFAMRVFADEAAVDSALGEAGLRLERRLDARWFVAVRAGAPRPGGRADDSGLSAGHRSRASSVLTSVVAVVSRPRFAGSLSQPLAPDGCGSGTTGVPANS